MAGQKQSRGGTPASSRGRGNQNPGQAARSGAAARSGTVTAQSGPGARNNAGPARSVFQIVGSAVDDPGSRSRRNEALMTP